MNHDFTSINENEGTPRRLLELKNWSASSDQTSHYGTWSYFRGLC